jgi:hypothetical protein
MIVHICYRYRLEKGNRGSHKAIEACMMQNFKVRKFQFLFTKVSFWRFQRSLPYQADEIAQFSRAQL